LYDSVRGVRSDEPGKQFALASDTELCVKVKITQLLLDRRNVSMAFGYQSDVYALEQHGVAKEFQFDRVRERAVRSAYVPGDDPG
jgi:hypothetical protein